MAPIPVETEDLPLLFGEEVNPIDTKFSNGIEHIALDAVVRVQTATTAGSGVIIDPKGLVLTSAHILLGAGDVIQIHLASDEHLRAKIIKIDRRRDLALLELPEGEYTSAQLGKLSDIMVGDRIYVAGYPLDMAGPITISHGIVSRIFQIPNPRRTMIQTDAMVNVGNSGGPIVNDRGEVWGIIFAVAGTSDFPIYGIAFAISIDTIVDDFLNP